MRRRLANADDHVGPRALGIVGSVALAIGGYSAGALPLRGSGVTLPFLADLGRYPALGLVCGYFGLSLLVVAWWRLLRCIGGAAPPTPRGLLVTLAAWSAPLVLTPPLFSRDVYSYLAQGAMARAGLDVYRLGPASFGGTLSAQVAAVWQHTPSPYGPVFIVLATLAVAVVNAKLVGGVLVLRLMALGGVGLLVAALPRLARRCGVLPCAALGLGVLNPLVLIHLVAGAHNDAVMLGLLAAGLAAAAAGRGVLAAIVVTLAGLVKVPAALGLLAVIELWSQRLPGSAPRVRAALLTGTIAAATTATVTALAGTGNGWIGALATPASAHSWSISAVLGHGTRALLDLVDHHAALLAIPVWRWVGVAGIVLTVLVTWYRRSQLGAVYVLGLNLGAVAILGPATRPWYVLWAVVPIAAAATDGPVRHRVALASAVLAVVVLPSGSWPNGTEVSLALLGGLLAVLALWAVDRATGRSAPASVSRT